MLWHEKVSFLAVLMPSSPSRGDPFILKKTWLIFISCTGNLFALVELRIKSCEQWGKRKTTVNVWGCFLFVCFLIFILYLWGMLLFVHFFLALFLQTRLLPLQYWLKQYWLKQYWLTDALSSVSACKKKTVSLIYFTFHIKIYLQFCQNAEAAFKFVTATHWCWE